MGACTFLTVAAGSTAREAFRRARKNAAWEYGHGGYTGTIAEKHSFVKIDDLPRQVAERLEAAGAKEQAEELRRLDSSWPSREAAEALAYALIDLEDKRIANKWGPAGCIALDRPSDVPPGGKRLFLFFGRASK